MTKVIRLMQAELTSRMRDKSFWLEAVLLPVVVTVIMGLALARVGQGKTPVVNVGVVAGSDDVVTVLVLKEAFKATGTLRTTFFLDGAEARAKLRARELDAIVFAPDGDPASISEVPLKVSVESGRTTQFQATMVARVTEAALRTMMADFTARRSVADLMAQNGGNPTPAWTTPTPTPVSAMLDQVSLPRFNALGARFAGLAVFFSLLSAFRLMGNIFSEHRRGLSLRLSGVPVHALSVAVGYIGTVALVASVQTLTVLVVGRVAFGVMWGPMGPLLLAILLASVASAAVALTLAVLPLGRSSRGLVGTLFVLGGSVLGGSLVPLDGANSTLQFFAKATLHYWVTGLFTGLARGLTAGQVAQLFAGVLLYGGIALTLAATFLARRRPSRA